MNKEQQLSNIKTVNKITLLVDLVLVLIYTVIFGIFFSRIFIPETSASLEFPEQILPQVYNVIGKTFSSGDLNLIVTVMAVFMIIGYATLIINFKHISNLKKYDYHQWEGSNQLVQGIISLATVNIASAALRFYSGHLTMKYSEGKSYYGVYKANWLYRKEKNRKSKIQQNEELTEAEKALKGRVRRQTILKVVRFTLIYVVLILFALFVLIPFYWMILTALKTFQESKAVNPSLTVSLRDLQWVNIKFVIEEMNFGLYIKNTLIVALISTAGTIVMTVLSAFAFSKIDFKGRETLFSLLLMTMMIPGEIYMITNFLTVSRQGFGWVGTGVDSSVGYFATMIIPAMVSVFYIFFLRQTFKQVPDSLYKAAKVDGCSDFKYLRRVMIPIAGPTIFTITILNILGSWSAFIWPRLITSLEPTIGENYWLISVALRENSFVIDKGGGMTETMFNLQIAATAIVTVPLVIVFLLLRKYIMTGVGRSGTKG